MIDVLVVDDDFMVARIHGGFVSRTPGFRVVGTAHTGAEALRLVEELAPHLVLLDVHLPDISGLEVLHRMRAMGAVPAVVMVTAERDVDAVRAALHGGATQYLVKPFPYDDLASRLLGLRPSLEALPGERSGEADQALIDRAFAVGSTATPPPLPKGLSGATADLVRRSLRERGEQSATECAETLGLSRVTARRYLEHFVALGAATVRLNYGSAGRPERRYRAAR